LSHRGGDINKENLRRLLEEVRGGNLSTEEALDRLGSLPYVDLGFAKIDTHRSLRRGFPEAIFCQGKSSEQVEEIVRKMRENTNRFMALRASEEVYERVKRIAPEAVYHPLARAILIGEEEREDEGGSFVSVITAGTADVAVAEEAAVTAEFMRNKVKRLYDVGVAGVHRLLDHVTELREANVLIVVAGMEGALPSIVGGLVERPVIAVPTSVGYGASFGGLSALLGALNSCVPGVAVVNIDNGFGAGYLAGLINQMAKVER